MHVHMYVFMCVLVCVLMLRCIENVTIISFSVFSLQISLKGYLLVAFTEKHEPLICNIWQNLPTAMKVPA